MIPDDIINEISKLIYDLYIKFTVLKKLPILEEVLLLRDIFKSSFEEAQCFKTFNCWGVSFNISKIDHVDVLGKKYRVVYARREGFEKQGVIVYDTCLSIQVIFFENSNFEQPEIYNRVLQTQRSLIGSLI